MTATTETGPGAGRHPGRGAARAPVAVRRRPTCCCASTTATTGGNWFGDCTGSSTAARTAPDSGHGRIGSPSPSPIPAWRRWACRRRRWTASRPSSGQGWPRARTQLGDVGESGPEHWEKPLGHGEVHVAVAALSPDAAALQPPWRSRRASAHARLAGRRADLASGLLPAARPAGRRSASRTASASPRSKGAAAPRRTRWSGRSRPARSSSATPTRRASCRRCRRPDVLGRNGTYVVFRKLHTEVAAYRQLPAGQRRRAARTRRSSARRWSVAGRAALRSALSPDRDDPELGADPPRNNDFGYADDPRGFKCPVGAHARRANPRDALDDDGQRRRAPPPDDPARAPATGRCCPTACSRTTALDRGIIFVFAGRPPADGSSSSSRPSGSTTASSSAPLTEKDPLVGTERRVGRLHHPAAPDPPPAAGPAAVRRDPRRRVLLRPGLRGAALAGGAGHVSRAIDRPEDDRDHGSRRDRPVERTRLRPTVRRRRGDRARRCSSTTSPTTGSR